MYPESKDEILQIYLDDIIPNRFQPREIFDERALKELAISIKEHGVIQPIIVRRVNGKYEIIAGERRYKAAALAGLTKIPAIVRDLDDKESSKVALLENLQRKNLNPIEEARTYQKILEIDQMTQEELAKTMGKSQSAVANKIRLLTLPEEIQSALLKEEISERHARSLLNVPDVEKQKGLLKQVIEEKMSVRSLEDLIKELFPKNGSSQDDKEEKEEKRIIATPDAFVNSKPLKPTTDLPEEKSNYGKVTIAPPEGEEDNMSNRFINYGEVGKEEDDRLPDTFNLSPSSTTVDVSRERETSMSVAPKKSGGAADLDSLLNLGNPTSSKPSNQFITPAEKIVKTDPGEEIIERNSDYFKMPEISSMNKESTIINSMDNNMFLSRKGDREESEDDDEGNDDLPSIDEIKQTGPYTIEDATHKIRKLVEELKEHGINITTNEMNFEKSYQVIIKIEKE